MNGRTMGANERKKVMYVRKMRKKWQCLVRHKGHRVAQSFEPKIRKNDYLYKVFNTGLFFFTYHPSNLDIFSKTLK